MSGSEIYNAFVRANTAGAGSTNPGFGIVAARELGTYLEEDVPARNPIALPAALPEIFEDLNRRLTATARTVGYEIGAFVPKLDAPDGVVAVTSSTLRAKGGVDGILGMAGSESQVEISYRAKDGIFDASIESIIDSVEKNTIVAAAALLDDLIRLAKEQGLNENDPQFATLKQELANIARAFSDEVNAKVKIKNGKIKGPYKEIIKEIVPKIAKFLYKAETDLGIETDQKREWYSALLNTELDLLSSRSRNVTVAMYSDGVNLSKVPEKIRDLIPDPPGIIAEIAWPLNTKSSMDRRGSEPAKKQQRVNFWLQQTIHYDNSGKVLSVSFDYRGASPNVIDEKNETKRLEATKFALVNEFRVYALIHLAEAIVNAKSGADINKIFENFKTMHVDNLGLMSTADNEYTLIKECRTAYESLLAENSGGMALGEDVINDLVRITKGTPGLTAAGISSEALRARLEAHRFKPTVNLDTMGTNMGRSAEAPSKFLAAIGRFTTIEKLQFNIRKKANTNRFAQFTTELNNRSAADTWLQPFQALFQNVKKENGEAFWRENKGKYLEHLENLRNEVAELMALANPTDVQKRMIADYEKLAIFAMHLEHNIKPQLSPLSVRAMIVGSDAHMSFIRQVITALMDQKVLNAREQDQIGGMLVQIYNCKSGKDRTAVFLAFKTAWAVVMDNQRKNNIPIDFARIDDYINAVHQLLPQYIDKSVSRDVCNSNSIGSTGVLGQNRVLLAMKHLIYEGDLVKLCKFSMQNKMARLKDVRWKSHKGKTLGVDGAKILELKQKNGDGVPVPVGKGARKKAVNRKSVVGVSGMDGGDEDVAPPSLFQNRLSLVDEPAGRRRGMAVTQDKRPSLVSFRIGSKKAIPVDSLAVRPGSPADPPITPPPPSPKDESGSRNRKS